MTSRFTKPLLRTHAPHCGQRGQEGGRRARAASTDSTRWLARTRANDHAARISAESVWASSTVQSKRCTAGSSSRMLSLRHSIGHRSPFGTRPGGSKSVPYVCCYASPPPTVNYAPCLLTMVGSTLVGYRRRHQDAGSKQPLMSPSMNHFVPFQILYISVRAVWHPFF